MEGDFASKLAKLEEPAVEEGLIRRRSPRRPDGHGAVAVVRENCRSREGRVTGSVIDVHGEDISGRCGGQQKSCRVAGEVSICCRMRQPYSLDITK